MSILALCLSTSSTKDLTAFCKQGSVDLLCQFANEASFLVKSWTYNFSG